MSEDELKVVKHCLLSAAKLLRAYPCRVGNDNFDTLDARWILMDPIVIMELIGYLDMYKMTEGRFDNFIAEEAAKVYLANYMAGGKNLYNMEKSKSRIRTVAAEMGKTFEQLKKVEYTPDNFMKNLTFVDAVIKKENDDDRRS